MSRFAKDAKAKLAGLGKGIAAGVAGGAAALTALAVKAVNTGDALSKLSTRLGAPVENLSRLQFAAERTGVASRTLELGLQRLGRRIGEVALFGRGEAIPALNELGLSATKLNELTVDKQFLAIADALQSVENPGKKLSLTMKLLDADGVKLLQTMEGGSAAISALADESDRLGNTFKSNAAAEAVKVKDALSNLQGTANGLGQELLVNLGPQVVKIAKLLTALLPKAVNIAQTSFIKLKAGIEGAAATVSFAYGKALETMQTALDSLSPGTFTGVFQKDADAALGTSRTLFAQMETTYKEGLAKIQATIDSSGLEGGSLKSIVPKLATLTGTNKAAGSDKKESDTAAKFAAETTKLVNLQDERFRRLNATALAAQGKDREVEALRLADQLKEINDQETRLRNRLGSEFALEQQFNKAREDAAKISAANITDIERSESEARKALKSAELKVIEGFFSTAGNLAKEGSKAQRVLFAIEKSIGIARSILALNVAKAQANASASFPANLGAILRATTVGLSAISAIKNVSARVSGGPTTAGRPYIVGENGPELYVPNTSGKVIPNNQLGGGGGLIVNLIEAEERQGQAELNGNELNVFVDTIRGALVKDVQSGRGIGRAIQEVYNVKRVGSI